MNPTIGSRMRLMLRGIVGVITFASFELSALSLGTFLPVRYVMIGGITYDLCMPLIVGFTLAMVLWLLFWLRLKKRINVALGIKTSGGDTLLGSFAWVMDSGSEAGRPLDMRELRILGVSFLLVVTPCWALVRITHAIWSHRVETLREEIQTKGWPTSLASFQEHMADDQYAYPALNEVIPKIEPALKKLMGWEKQPLLEPSFGTVQLGEAEVYVSIRPACTLAEKVIQDNAAPILNRAIRLRNVDYRLLASDPISWRELLLPQDSYFQNRMVYVLDDCGVQRAFGGDVRGAWDNLRLLARYDSLYSTDSRPLVTLQAKFWRDRYIRTTIKVMLADPRSTLPADQVMYLRPMASGQLVTKITQEQIAWWFDARKYVERHWIELPHPPKEVSPFPGQNWWIGRSYRYPWLLVKFATPVLFATGVWDRHVLLTCQAAIKIQSQKSWSEAHILLATYDDEFLRSPLYPYWFEIAGETTEIWKVLDEDGEIRDRAKLALLLSELNRFHNLRNRYPPKLGDLDQKLVGTENAYDVVTDRAFDYQVSPGGQGFALCSLGLGRDWKDRRGEDFCVRQHF